MTAGAAEAVDTIASYARRAEGRVRVVLHLPDLQGSGTTEAQIRLRGSGRTVKAQATVVPTDTGVRVESNVPAKRLPADVWRIAVRLQPSTEFHRVQARLLTSRSQPIALLPGPAPRTQMAPPQRATDRAASYRTTLRSVTRRLRRGTATLRRAVADRRR